MFETNRRGYMMAGPSFANVGQWIGTYRGFFAFPFTNFILNDGTTSTKNIVLFIYKAAACPFKPLPHHILLPRGHCARLAQIRPRLTATTSRRCFASRQLQTMPPQNIHPLWEPLNSKLQKQLSILTQLQNSAAMLSWSWLQATCQDTWLLLS